MNVGCPGFSRFWDEAKASSVPSFDAIIRFVWPAIFARPSGRKAGQRTSRSLIRICRQVSQHICWRGDLRLRNLSGTGERTEQRAIRRWWRHGNGTRDGVAPGLQFETGSGNLFGSDRPNRDGQCVETPVERQY